MWGHSKLKLKHKVEPESHCAGEFCHIFHGNCEDISRIVWICCSPHLPEISLRMKTITINSMFISLRLFSSRIHFAFSALDVFKFQLSTKSSQQWERMLMAEEIVEKKNNVFLVHPTELSHPFFIKAAKVLWKKKKRWNFLLQFSSVGSGALHCHHSSHCPPEVNFWVKINSNGN